MSNKSKAIKIPMQLEELVRENEKMDKPIGEMLLEAYKQYLKLKELAGMLPEMEGRKESLPVSSVLIRHIENEKKDEKLRKEIIIEIKKILEKLQSGLLELRNRSVKQ